MKALVTGATGFVGSRLVRRLVEEGNSVAVLVRAGSRFDQLATVRDDIRFFLVDDAVDSMQRAVASERPDVVFHLATYYAFDHHPDDIAPMIESNVLFPIRLVDAMVREGVSCLVNAGTAWQHHKDAAYDPVCLHAASKQAFETLLTYFVNACRIRCITLKLNDTYGPDDPRRKIFTLLRERAGKGDPLDMSEGRQLIDLVHVDDVTRAFLLAASRLVANDMIEPHEDYVVSSGRPLPLRDLVETYLRICGEQVPIRWGKRAYRDREVMVPWTGGSTLPGWRPSVSLEAGLAELCSKHSGD